MKIYYNNGTIYVNHKRAFGGFYGNVKLFSLKYTIKLYSWKTINHNINLLSHEMAAGTDNYFDKIAVITF